MPEPTGATSIPASSGAPAVVPAAHLPQEVTVSRSEKSQLAMRLEREHGSFENAALHLAGKQIRYQKRAQEAERQTAEVRKLLPPEGAVVLTGDEAKAVQKLREQKVDLVKLPDDLKASGELRLKVTAQERKTAVSDAAGKKYKSAVLARLLGDTPDGKTIGLPLEFQDTMVKKEDGTGFDTVKVPHVRVGDKLVALDTWMETDQKDWMEVAKASEEEGGTGGSSGGSSSSSSSSTSSATMPKQTATGGGGGGGTTPKPKDSAAIVDRHQSKYMTPGQRAAAAEKKT